MVVLKGVLYKKDGDTGPRIFRYLDGSNLQDIPFNDGQLSQLNALTDIEPTMLRVNGEAFYQLPMWAITRREEEIGEPAVPLFNHAAIEGSRPFNVQPTINNAVSMEAGTLSFVGKIMSPAYVDEAPASNTKKDRAWIRYRVGIPVPRPNGTFVTHNVVLSKSITLQGQEGYVHAINKNMNKFIFVMNAVRNNFQTATEPMYEVHTNATSVILNIYVQDNKAWDEAFAFRQPNLQGQLPPELAALLGTYPAAAISPTKPTEAKASPTSSSTPKPVSESKKQITARQMYHILEKKI